MASDEQVSEADISRFLPILQKYVDTPELQFVECCKDLVALSVGKGNLNDVIRISDKDEQNSVIVKHAPPYIKCLGPTYPLTPTRGDIEYRALQQFHRLSSGSVPVPYFYDKDSNLICMQDLKKYKDFRNELIEGKCNESIVQKIARDIALVHRGTHIATLERNTFRSLLDEFRPSDLVSLTEQYVFTKPFHIDDPTNRSSPAVKQRGIDLVYRDAQVLATAESMKTVFLEKKECLLHGDLHTESVMVHGSDSKIMDLEFAFMGPASFDVGMLLANYIFSYYCHMSNPENHDQRRKFANSMIDMCKLTVSTYLDHMAHCIADTDAFTKTFHAEMAGFAGCEIVRRILGAAHVSDLEGSDHASVDALGAGVRLLLAKDRIDSVDRLLVIALMLA